MTRDIFRERRRIRMRSIVLLASILAIATVGGLGLTWAVWVALEWAFP